MTAEISSDEMDIREAERMQCLIDSALYCLKEGLRLLTDESLNYKRLRTQVSHSRILLHAALQVLEHV